MMENENEVMELNTKAKILVESGYFPDIKSAAQAQVKIWIGKSLGLNEYQSLTGIYITTKGQIGLMSSVMSSLIKMNPKYDYFIDELTNEKCAISFFRIGADKKEVLLGQSTFDLKDAARCGLANKETFKSYPRNLLFARALANGARFYCPETIAGFYERGEIMEIEDIAPAHKTTIGIDMNGGVTHGTT